MEDIKNTQVKRLYVSLLNHTDEKTAYDIACRIKLPKNPSDKKKFEWAEDICSKLDNSFDNEKVKQIRMGCCCKPPLDKIKGLKEAYNNSKNLNDYAEKLNTMNPGASFWCDNGALFISYPVCYCSFVRKTDRLLPVSWCYCTLGHAKYVYEYVFECELVAKLIESIKTGGTRCVIKISKSC